MGIERTDFWKWYKRMYEGPDGDFHVIPDCHEPSLVSQAAPVDTTHKPKIGRPRTGFNKKEYNRQFTADLRTIKRLGLNCTVKEYRESLK
jgi:hypothetical protein